MSDKESNKQKEDQFFIRKRELGELFDSTYPLEINLWRGNNPHNKNPILYPILKSFLLSNGRLRKEDIKTYTRNNELWVDATSGGISLFDKRGIPVKSWEYFMLKARVKIPLGLVITKDDWKENFGAHHYTIRPNWDMPVKTFCTLLDDLMTKLIKD